MQYSPHQLRRRAAADSMDRMAGALLDGGCPEISVISVLKIT